MTYFVILGILANQVIASIAGSAIGAAIGNWLWEHRPSKRKGKGGE